MPAQTLELESPFSDYSLQEVVFCLRFLYSPADITPDNLAAVEQHALGAARLAHALNAPNMLRALDAALVSRMEDEEAALRWLPVGDACQMSAALGQGIR